MLKLVLQIFLVFATWFGTSCLAEINENRKDLSEVLSGKNLQIEDGTPRRVRIVADEKIAKLVEELNRVFCRQHPEIQCELSSGKGVSAMAGLSAGASLFALMLRPAWPLEIRPFRQVHGYEPAHFQIARMAVDDRHGLQIPVVLVNAQNPIEFMSMGQLSRVFTVGNKPGDFTHWRQLGITGKWQQRMIHLYGRRDRGTEMTGLRYNHWDGRPLASHYEPLDTDAEIISAIRDDPYGIAIVTTGAGGIVPQGVRALPLARHIENDTSERFSIITPRNPDYPLANALHLYVDRSPGGSADPVVEAYLEFLLLPQGQSVIEQFTGQLFEFSRLTPAELLQERLKLR